MLYAHDLVQAEPSGKGAREEHRHDRDLGGGNAGIHRRRLALAHHPKPESPGGSPDQYPDDKGGAQRQEESQVEGRRRERDPQLGKHVLGGRKERALREFPALGRLLAGLYEHIDQQIGHQRRGDEVEHDRRDHDVASPLRLEPGRDEGPGGAEQGARQDRDWQEDPKRPRAKPEANKPHSKTADVGLALGSDVEEPGMVGDRNGKPREDEVRRVVEGESDGILGSEGPRDHQLEGCQRTLADEPYQEAGKN